MTPVFIYICFGREDDYYQTLFSVLSVAKYTKYFEASDHHMIIYTDAPDFFNKYLVSSKHKIEIRTLNQVELYALKGGSKLQQVFRVKLALISQTLSEQKRDVFYLDADTYFIKDFTKELSITPDTSGMCSDEGLIAKKKNQINAYEILKKFPQYFSDLENVKMYNAGLVYVHFENKKLIDQALTLMDEIYPDFKYYFFEQTLVSYILGKHTKVKTFDSYLRHYWYMKHFTLVIREFVKSLPFNILQEKSLPDLPINAIPSERIYKSFLYQWPIKLKRRLVKWGIVSA